MRVVTVFSLAIACSAERAPPAVRLAQDPAKPVDTVDGSLLPPSTRVTPGTEACLMLYECGCNAGCMKIDRPMTSLKPGMQAQVTSGGLKGTSVFVAKQPTDTGDTVLTVQRNDPSSAIQICAAVPRASVMGYLCGDSGPARACRTCD